MEVTEVEKNGILIKREHKDEPYQIFAGIDDENVINDLRDAVKDLDGHDYSEIADAVRSAAKGVMITKQDEIEAAYQQWGR